MDTSELHSVKALLDCRATGSFIDRDFVRSKGMNTQTLSQNISVFNVDGSPNEAGQITEVVDIVLCYKTHSERMLLAVSRLGKQSLILGYDWLKDHNPKIDWKKGEVEMTRCPLRCEGGRAKRGKWDFDCDKQVEKAVTVPNCVLKGSWEEVGSGGIRKKLKSEYAAYLESKFRRNDGSSI